MPDNGTRKKTKTKENSDSVLTTLNATINDIKESLSNDNSNELLKFLKEESAKQAKGDGMFLNLMSAMVNNTKCNGDQVFLSCIVAMEASQSEILLKNQYHQHKCYRHSKINVIYIL